MISASHWGLVEEPIEDDRPHYDLPAPGGFVLYGTKQLTGDALVQISGGDITEEQYQKDQEAGYANLIASGVGYRIRGNQGKVSG